MSTDDSSAAGRGSGLSAGLGLVPEWAPSLEFSERAIDRFVYSQEPAGDMAAEFRADLAAVIAEAVAAERERWRNLLVRALPMLQEHADYANSAPVWHCTGYEANTLNALIPEIEEVLGPNA